MYKSLSYYIVLFVLKIKGTKSVFSHSPIDYLHLRKDDVFEPSHRFFKTAIKRKFSIAGTDITEIAHNANPKKLLIYLHGGALVSGPAIHHWDSIKKMAQNSDYTIWMGVYPKAPEHKISDINNSIDNVYSLALKSYNAHNIVLMGDSAGGTLCLTLTQRLIKNHITIPSKLVVISPVIDASMQNPDIDPIELLDPMISKNGVESAKKMAAGNLDMKDEQISPLYGSVDGFPMTYLFLAEHDICFPDQLLFCKKLTDAHIRHKATIGQEMPHIWPLLPVMSEAKKAMNEIIEILNSN